MQGNKLTYSWKHRLIRMFDDERISEARRLYLRPILALPHGFNHILERVLRLIRVGEDWSDVPSNWSVVFQVDGTDAAVAKVEELGGRRITEPMDIPGVGRFAVVADPWGAVFQVIT